MKIVSQYNYLDSDVNRTEHLSRKDMFCPDMSYTIKELVANHLLRNEVELPEDYDGFEDDESLYADDDIVIDDMSDYTNLVEESEMLKEELTKQSFFNKKKNSTKESVDASELNRDEE